MTSTVTNTMTRNPYAHPTLPKAVGMEDAFYHSQSSSQGSNSGESGPTTPIGFPAIPMGQQLPNKMPPSFALASKGRQRLNPGMQFQNQSAFHFNNAMSQQREQMNQNRRTKQAPQESLPFPDCVYHKNLVDKLEFIQAPHVTSAGAPMINQPCYRVFIGQVRFETTAAEMRWLIHYLTGISAIKVEVRGMGCFMAYFSTYDEVHRVCELRFRLLFDHNGVWFARHPEQAEILQRYVSCYVSSIGRGFRLPKDMMVIEEEKYQPYAHPSHGRGDECPAPQMHFQPSNSQSSSCESACCNDANCCSNTCSTDADYSDSYYGHSYNSQSYNEVYSQGW